MLVAMFTTNSYHFIKKDPLESLNLKSLFYDTPIRIRISICIQKNTKIYCSFIENVLVNDH